MNPLYIAQIQISLMLALPGMFMCQVLQSRHKEVIRPLIGNLLFRKNKIPQYCDVPALFKVGNHRRPVTDSRSFWYSYDRLSKYAETSYFKHQDRKRLQGHAEWMLRKITEQENLERERRRQEEEARARARAKASLPKQNRPIQGWRTILGVDANCACTNTIKNTYRRLASKYHPDKNPNVKEATARMAEINRALDAARQELNFV